MQLRLITFLFLVAVITGTSIAQVASGFRVTNRSGGVTTYRKDYFGGQPDFVTVAKLDAGGIVSNITGAWRNDTIENHPFVDYKNAAWNGNTTDKEALVVFNGTFFGKAGWWGQVTDSTIGTWTAMSFGLKFNSNTTFGIDTRHNLARLLCYNGQSARSLDYSTSEFANWSTVIGAFKGSVQYNDDQREKRNWFGLRDGDHNGSYDTIVFYFSNYSNRNEVVGVLGAGGFECSESTMGFLDTGASSGYWLKGTGDIAQPAWYRWIPHAIAVYARPPVNSAAYVADLNYPDGTVVAPGTWFSKKWRILNKGNTTWGGNDNPSDGYHWTFDGGYQFGGSTQVNAPAINPNQTWDPEVNLQAPTTPGTYRGYWRMASPSGAKFGTRVWVEIRVTGASEYIVDQSDAAPYNGAIGFWKWGTPSYWHYVNGIGYGGTMIWTYNNDVAHGVDNKGDWRPSLPETRNYEVFVFIPRNYATTTQARYEINHALGRTDVIVNQLIYYDVWVSLGTYRFNSGISGFVRLADMTNEPYISRMIGFDAMKWVTR